MTIWYCCWSIYILLADTMTKTMIEQNDQFEIMRMITPITIVVFFGDEGSVIFVLWVALWSMCIISMWNCICCLFIIVSRSHLHRLFPTGIVYSYGVWCITLFLPLSREYSIWKWAALLILYISLLSSICGMCVHTFWTLKIYIAIACGQIQHCSSIYE